MKKWLAFLLALLMLVTVAELPLTEPAQAAAANSSVPRIGLNQGVAANWTMKASSKNVSVKVGQEKKVKFTFNEYGKLRYKIKNTSIVDAYWDSEWDGNTIRLHLVGKKKGSTTVTVTNTVNKAKIVIKVTVKKGTTSTSGAKYRAVLIGNSNYWYENKLPNHKWDVTAMKGLLTKSLKTKYTVKDKYDCSASEILSAIRSGFSGAKDNDVSLFYYGGHGMQYDGSLCGVDNTFVSPTQLRDALLAVPGKVIVILECCHSGSMVKANGGAADLSTPKDFNDQVISAFSGYTIAAQDGDAVANTGELRSSKFIVLTACEKYEESWNWWYYDSSWVDQSFGTFTKAMFNGLGCKWSTGVWTGSAPCDSNGDNVATLGECASYIRSHASAINREMGGSNEQHCASYGDKNFKLFQLTR